MWKFQTFLNRVRLYCTTVKRLYLHGGRGAGRSFDFYGEPKARCVNNSIACSSHWGIDRRTASQARRQRRIVTYKCTYVTVCTLVCPSPQLHAKTVNWLDMYVYERACVCVMRRWYSANKCIQTFIGFLDFISPVLTSPAHHSALFLIYFRICVVYFAFCLHRCNLIEMQQANCFGSAPKRGRPGGIRKLNTLSLVPCSFLQSSNRRSVASASVNFMALTYVHIGLTYVHTRAYIFRVIRVYRWKLCIKSLEWHAILGCMCVRAKGHKVLICFDTFWHMSPSFRCVSALTLCL